MIRRPGIDLHKIPVIFLLEFDHGIDKIVFGILSIVEMPPGRDGGTIYLFPA
jgi:hypothetical protein